MSEAAAEVPTNTTTPAVVDPTTPAVVAETVTPEISDDNELSAAYDRAMTNDAPARDTDGKFTAKDGKAAATDENKSAAESVEQKPEMTAEAGGPPAHLPQAIKESWKDIPETARTAIAAHQAEMDRKFGEVGTQLRTVKPIADRLVQLTQEHPEFRGLDPNQLAQGAFELAVVRTNLDKNPVETLLQIAQHYGVLDGVAARLSGQQPTEQADNFQHLTGTMRELQNKITELSDPNRVNQQIAASMMQRDADNIVNAFADPKNGKAYYADVEDEMPAFIEIARQKGSPDASLQDILDSAYDMAINAIPAVRDKARAAEQAKAAPAPDPKRTEAAKKAASINVKSTLTGKEHVMTEDEAMASAYDRAMAS